MKKVAQIKIQDELHAELKLILAEMDSEIAFFQKTIDSAKSQGTELSRPEARVL